MKSQIQHCVFCQLIQAWKPLDGCGDQCEYFTKVKIGEWVDTLCVECTISGSVHDGKFIENKVK